MNNSLNAKLYCPSMWKSVHVDVDSYLTPCCLFIHGQDKKTKITDVNRIETVLIDEFQPYRDQLTNGEWPSGCNQCKFAEEEGRASKRQQDMMALRGNNNGGMLTDPENVALEYLQLKTGRLCNLECTICTPSCSTSIAATHLKKGIIARSYYDKLQQEIAWASNLTEFKKMDSEYFRIDIAGGEPLMNKTHFQWLSQLKNTHKTQLLYNTNGTFIPSESEVEIWSRFKGIWIAFSVDSIGERFEKLRVNAKWDQVLHNMQYITDHIVRDKLKHQQGYTNTSIVMTIHKGNILDVFDLWDTVNAEVNWIQDDPVNFNYLYYPESQAIHNMEKEQMKEAIELFEKNIPRLPPELKFTREATRIKDSLITFLSDKQVIHDRQIARDHRQ